MADRLHCHSASPRRRRGRRASASGRHPRRQPTRRWRLGLQRERSQRRRLDGVRAAVSRAPGRARERVQARGFVSGPAPADGERRNRDLSRAGPDSPIHGRGSVDTVQRLVPTAHRGDRDGRSRARRPRAEQPQLGDRCRLAVCPVAAACRRQLELVLVDVASLRHPASGRASPVGGRSRGRQPCGRVGDASAGGGRRLECAGCRDLRLRNRPVSVDPPERKSEPATGGPCNLEPRRPSGRGWWLAQSSDHADSPAGRY